MKTCSKCGEVKDINLFDKNKLSVDGRTSYCKLCKKLYDKSYRKEKLKRFNASTINFNDYKVCSKCNESKNISEFTLNGYINSGFEGQCKACQNLYSKLRRKRVYGDIYSKYKSGPCKDCGKTYHPCQMHFDHLRDKKHNIGHLVTSSTKKLEEEISKCDLVCANCHALRTWKRNQGK